MKKKVCVLTGTRADYGLLRELLFLLNDSDLVDLRLLVTGTHLKKEFGNTHKEIQHDGFEKFDCIAIPLEDDSKLGMVRSTGEAIKVYGEYLNQIEPDLMVILGDRYEAFAAGVACHILGIPIAHISGGDVTEGALDDAFRHCLTKMSYLHFPGCADSTKRIVQMGESPQRVFNVGEPGIENCLKMRLLDRNALAENLGFDIVNHNYAVVTFHPVTLENDTAISEVYEIIKAMDEHSDLYYIVTMANADESGRAINELWRQEGKHHSNWLVVESLGVLRYLSAVKYAKAVIGNSSSGIVEAPSMKTPTVNIGDRQKGRMMSDSVLCCDPICEQISDAISKVITDDFQEVAERGVSPFGDGNTSQKIMEQIIKYLDYSNEKPRKKFFDIR